MNDDLDELNSFASVLIGATPPPRDLRGDELTSQALIADGYRAICEAALAIKIGSSMNGMALLILAGRIMDEPDFSARLDRKVAAWRAEMIARVGANFMISEGVPTLEANQQFPLQVAAQMTHDEKIALRWRLQKAGALPKP